MNPDSLVIVFAKNPVPGRVKTRLAKELGPIEALRIYDKMATRIWECMLTLRGRSGAQVWLCFDPPHQSDPVQAWLAGADRYLPQVGGDLGNRMGAALREAMKLGFRQIAIVGTDAPDLGADQVEGAIARAVPERTVLGPTPDGGFYLLAVAGPDPDPEGLFRDVRWSSSHTLEDVARNVQDQGGALTLLASLPDIDTLQDLEAYRRSPSQRLFGL